jgi:hypothetical protein
MFAVGRVILSAVWAAACLTAQAAMADRIERITTAATPDKYDGKCPVLVKLQGVVIFSLGGQDNSSKFSYHWESGADAITEDTTGSSFGRQNRVEATVQIDEPVGQPVTIPIRLRAGIASYHPAPGKTRTMVQLDNFYSEPVNVVVTCR